MVEARAGTVENDTDNTTVPPTAVFTADQPATFSKDSAWNGKIVDVGPTCRVALCAAADRIDDGGHMRSRQSKTFVTSTRRHEPGQEKRQRIGTAVPPRLANRKAAGRHVGVWFVDAVTRGRRLVEGIAACVEDRAIKRGERWRQQ